MKVCTSAILVFITIFYCMFTAHNANAQESASTKWWDEEITAQLKLAESNAAEIERALLETPDKYRSALSFLIENLNPKDLQSVTSELLLKNVKLAFEARAKMPWGQDIPEDIFLNDVLPYYNVDETRELWRPRMYELCRPIVADCKTPAEAAQRLNEQLFQKVGVKYSTARKRANQSPSESMEQGLASCTGLSVLLADACRSVCVPARLAGIPSWPNKRGNHTWIEVWDGGWHFTGAAEPNPKGLNHTWFQNDAALADKSSRLHSIYAVSFKKGPTTFPLVWSRDAANPVYAVNVTDRYADPEKIAAMKAAQNSVQAMFRIWNADRTKRIVAEVSVKGPGNENELQGMSRNNQADMNDLLTFKLNKNSKYEVRVKHQDQESVFSFETGGSAQQLLEFSVPVRAPTKVDDRPSPVIESAADFFSANEEERKSWKFADEATQAYQNNPSDFRKSIWKAYLTSPAGQRFKEDFENQRVTFNEHVSPYTVKEVGKRPKNGWPLFIAMHGGGGAPARVNDQQWKHMQIYYKDQANVEGYKYLALRAPNNTWNGFYDDYVYPLIENLIQQFIVHGDIDANKVFIMGYSHGGYGAFAIGPKIPYRFAAVHSSAAAPTDGETSAKTLRNTRFTFMVGEKDNAYGRRERCEKFAEQIKLLKGDRDDIYPVEFLFKPGYGHGGLPDRDMISEMYGYVRGVVPKHVTWELTDGVVKRFFWLRVNEPQEKQLVDAVITDNQIMVNATDINDLTVLLDERLIDPGKPIVIKVGERKFESKYRPSLESFCRTLLETGDLNLAFDGEVNVISGGE